MALKDGLVELKGIGLKAEFGYCLLRAQQMAARFIQERRPTSQVTAYFREGGRCPSREVWVWQIGTDYYLDEAGRLYRMNRRHGTIYHLVWPMVDGDKEIMRINACL
jgi:hypothetical protein